MVRRWTPLIGSNPLSLSQVSELGLSKESDRSNCQLLRLKSLDLSFNKVGQQSLSSSGFYFNFFVSDFQFSA